MKISKRHHRSFITDSNKQTYIDRHKCEQMCKSKLKKISKVNCNLIKTVLIRNTLKYVQTTDYVTFACDDNLEDEPLCKRQYKDTFRDDIEYILYEMTSLKPLLLPIEDFSCTKV